MSSRFIARYDIGAYPRHRLDQFASGGRVRVEEIGRGLFIMFGYWAIDGVLAVVYWLVLMKEFAVSMQQVQKGKGDIPFLPFITIPELVAALVPVVFWFFTMILSSMIAARSCKYR
jgi:hypothetical protein